MRASITPVRFRPHDLDYQLDVEVLDAVELRRRVASVPDRGHERADFQSFLIVDSGSYSHVVDFEVHDCGAGSCLLIRPGQVHRFGPPSEWDGWILIVGPQHVPGGVGELPGHVRLESQHATAVRRLLQQMATDARMDAPRGTLNALLALQTQVLVQRLALGGAGRGAEHLVDPAILGRSREFRAAVDREFRRWHLVAPYARHLGCSPKSLDRACRAVGAMSAKRVIVERIVLEAKRLLAQTTFPVAAISSHLGFDEPTNFVKYFKRETGTTPARFRAQLSADPTTVVLREVDAPDRAPADPRRGGAGRWNG